MCFTNGSIQVCIYRGLCCSLRRMEAIYFIWNTNCLMFLYTYWLSMDLYAFLVIFCNPGGNTEDPHFCKSHVVYFSSAPLLDCSDWGVTHRFRGATSGHSEFLALYTSTLDVQWNMRSQCTLIPLIWRCKSPFCDTCTNSSENKCMSVIVRE